MNELPSRFIDKVYFDPNSGCWIWHGSLTSDLDGYGQFWNGERLVMAHRYSYEAFGGSIEDGLELDHLCRVRRCVNPVHLEVVSHLENVRRGRVGEANSARKWTKTHCPQGHPYVDSNVLYNKNGWRRCRECNKINCNKRTARKKLEECT